MAFDPLYSFLIPINMQGEPMPRKSRLYQANMPYIVHQTANKDTFCFLDDEDRLYFLLILQYALNRYHLALHAFVLLDETFKLLLTPKTTNGISQLMQMLSGRYTKYYNQKYQKDGNMWYDRYKASHVEDPAFILATMRYMESLPVARGKVNHPEQYKWSSYLDNVGNTSFEERFSMPIDQGKSSANQINETVTMTFNRQYDRKTPFITEHQNFKRLGNGLLERKGWYKTLFFMDKNKVNFQFFDDRLKHGYPIGSAEFIQYIEELFSVKFRQVKPGRPRKKP